jgi:hypothetical protein
MKLPTNPFRKEFMTYQDNLYIIRAVHPVERVKDHNGIKQALGCNLVLRQQNQMYFLEQVEDVVFEETII